MYEPDSAVSTLIARSAAARFATVHFRLVRLQSATDLVGAARAVAPILVVAIGTVALVRMRAARQRQAPSFL